jgi:hypothetical protein
MIQNATRESLLWGYLYYLKSLRRVKSCDKTRGHFENTMKTHQTLSQLLLQLALVLSTALGSSFACAQTVASGIAKIVTGDVRISDAQGERVLKSGDAVFENTRLIAGKQSSASVVLRDGTTLVLSENSQFNIQSFSFDATTQNGGMLINVLQGSMRMLTGLIAKINPDAIQVKTKTLSVGIRGTDFIVDTEDKP